MDRGNNKVTDFATEICANIINASKENSSNLDALIIWQASNANSSSWNGYWIYGDNSCLKNINRKCLRSITMNDIYNPAGLANRSILAALRLLSDIAKAVNPADVLFFIRACGA